MFAQPTAKGALRSPFMQLAAALAVPAEAANTSAAAPIPVIRAPRLMPLKSLVFIALFPLFSTTALQFQGRPMVSNIMDK
jgi:hypothetical protein